MKNLSKEIKPVSKISARIRLPGSKSITHRALIMAALSTGPAVIDNPLRAEDTLLTAGALEALGATIDWGAHSVRVMPPAFRWRQPGELIFLGNSGTSARLLLALFSAGTGTFVLDGAPRLQQRPLGPVAAALEKLGARMRWIGKTGFLPVEINSRGLVGGEVFVDASESSQFLSGVLIVAPTAGSRVTVEWSEPAASWPYVEMTLAMMKEAGIRFERMASSRIEVPAPQTYSPRSFTVEGDCSSASYFWGAAALTGGEVLTSPVSPLSLQGDCRFLGVLDKMGCRIEWKADGVCVKGPAQLLPVDVDMNEMPDMVPTLSVLSAFASGTSRIRNVAHLRIKESDRLNAVAAGLKALGVSAEELPDGLIVHGGAPVRASRPIWAFEDHRIAMAFALAGLRTGGVIIEGAESVNKSFPQFWDIFDALGSNPV
ncbi:MAG TPA: 3-phosphoshikimate 1-carboxyvinyltransferase [Syntrophobacteraceae bacterium]|nr:3-phosphoshikimate 1-carboxyvinyltransferase [Syntrophobacteraceae bacterium]